jgi:hypothetical protein
MHDSTVDKTSSAQAREDALAMLRQMRPALGVLVLGYILATMSWFAAAAIVPAWLGQYVLRMLAFMALAWAGAPFLLSLYRFVALGETRALPPLTYDAPVRTFAAYASLMTALYFVPALGFEIVAPLAGAELATATWLAFMLTVWVIVIRASTLLPMAALDPHTASWAAAMAHTRGQFLRTFLTVTVPAGPAFAGLLVLGLLVRNGVMVPLLFFPAAVVILLAIQLLPLSAATHLYLEQRRQESRDTAPR